VRHLLAVQSQDYAGAKWALAQRLRASTTDAELDGLFDAGAILRTHVLRPTWHFVDPADIRWLLALTGPRVHQANAYQYRLLELDAETRRQTRAVIERTLAGGRAMTREELGRALDAAGIPASGPRLGYITADAELEALICSGPRSGRRQTYALLEERVAPSRPLERDEALGELARRFVEGHGPAQAADLAWWSGLTVADARLALDLATPPLERVTVGERAFWFAGDLSAARAVGAERPAVRLLPNYDELLIAFRDRTDAMDPALPPPARVAQVILAHVIVRDGLVVGGWRRVDGGPSLTVEASLLVALDRVERAALDAQAERLSRFLGKPVEASRHD
jgi:winged helix DNA-binding protein